MKEPFDSCYAVKLLCHCAIPTSHSRTCFWRILTRHPFYVNNQREKRALVQSYVLVEVAEAAEGIVELTLSGPRSKLGFTVTTGGEMGLNVTCGRKSGDHHKSWLWCGEMWILTMELIWSRRVQPFPYPQNTHSILQIEGITEKHTQTHTLF